VNSFTIPLLLLTATIAVAQPALPRAGWASEDLGGQLDRALGVAADGSSSTRRNPGSNRRSQRAPAQDRPIADGDSSSDLIIAGLLGAGVVTLMAFVGVWLWRERGTKITRRTDGSARAELEEAQRLLGSEDASGALRACYRFAVQALRDHRVIPSADTLPDRLILRRLGGDPTAAAFTRLSIAFQPMHYGGATPPLDAARRAMADASEIDRLLGTDAGDPQPPTAEVPS